MSLTHAHGEQGVTAGMSKLQPDASRWATQKGLKNQPLANFNLSIGSSKVSRTSQHRRIMIWLGPRDGGIKYSVFLLQTDFVLS